MTASTRLKTRPENVSQHPGEAQKKYNKKSKEAAQAERDQKKAEKAQKDALIESGTKKAAALELEAKKKKALTKTQVGASTNELDIERVRHPRPASPQVDEENDEECEETPAATDTGPKKRVIVRKVVYEEVDVDAEMHESSASESEYQKSAEADESESSDPGMESEEEDVELEGDDPDTDLAKRKVVGGKKKTEKKGITVRNKIRTMRDKDTEHMTLDVDQGPVKRKASSALPSEKPPTKKKAKNDGIPTGLVPAWEKEDVLLPAPSNGRSRRGSSPDSTFSRASSRTMHDTTSEHIAAFQEGGISSDADDGLYRKERDSSQLRDDARGGKGTRYRSIAKIEDIDNAPRIFKRSQGNKRPTFKNIPHEVAKLYDTIKSSVIETAGQNNAWEPLSDEQIVNIWNGCFETDYPISPNDENVGSVELFKTIQKLMNRSISQWIHRFGASAVDNLKDEYQSRNLESLDDRITFIFKMLGKENQTDKDRPFLWKSSDETDWNPKDNRSGLFLGRMLIKTLAEHFVFVTPPSEELEEKLYPRGALMLAIQAVHRALLYSVAGAFDPPKGPKEAEFSRANWGDYEQETKSASGQKTRKLVRRATLFKGRIDAMSDTHWTAIIDQAKENMPRKGRGKKKAPPADTVDIEVVADEEDDESSLFDPMFA